MFSWMKSLVMVGLATLVIIGVTGSAWATEAETPTYTKDIVPILNENCVSCHRTDEVAPMSFETYKQVRPWARSIKSKVVSREMPPWHAEPNVGLKFKNDRHLSQEVIDTIVAWVDGGAPQGNKADLPPAPSFAEGWQHPTGRAPDFIVPLPVEYHLPPAGSIQYVDFFAKIPLEEDAYAEAVETRPGNRAAVHHITVNPREFEEPPDPGPTFADIGTTSGNGGRQIRAAVEAAAERGEELDIPLPSQRNARQQNALLGLFTPGQGFEQFPPGYGMKVKGGPTTYLHFNMHYQLTGRPEIDRSSFAVWLHRDPIEFEMKRNGGVEGTVIAEGQELLDGEPGIQATGTYAVIPKIPAGADNFKTAGIAPFLKDTIIYQFNPHAHLRGKAFTYSLVYPDGREEMLLSVPKYDFNWQLIYELDEPLIAPAGSKLVTTAHYDNSHKNRYNPAPDRDVNWAEQSWEEMFIPFVMYAAEPSEELPTDTTDN